MNDDLLSKLATRIASVDAAFGLLTEPKAAKYPRAKRAELLSRLESSIRAIERLLKEGAAEAIGPLDGQAGRDWILKTLDYADEARTIGGSLALCKTAAERHQHVAHDARRIHRVGRQLGRRWITVDRLIGATHQSDTEKPRKKRRKKRGEAKVSRTAKRYDTWLDEYENGNWANVSEFAVEKQIVGRSAMSKGLKAARERRESVNRSR